ncbi:MAG TPA: T9SS type A sorting domain-containing protein [Cytophagaceae bacterium]
MVDSRLVKQYTENTGGLIYNESDVGGFPIITAGNPYVDSDKDGMADKWETIFSFNTNDSSDGSEDADNDGYTNVEEFLNGSNPLKTITELTDWEMVNQSRIFPNPAHHQVVINNVPLGVEVAILDLHGRMLISYKVDSKNTEINLRPFPAGLYMIKVGTCVQKLRIE